MCGRGCGARGDRGGRGGRSVTDGGVGLGVLWWRRRWRWQCWRWWGRWGFGLGKGGRRLGVLDEGVGGVLVVDDVGGKRWLGEAEEGVGNLAKWSRIASIKNTSSTFCSSRIISCNSSSSSISPRKRGHTTNDRHGQRIKLTSERLLLLLLPQLLLSLLLLSIVSSPLWRVGLGGDGVGGWVGGGWLGACLQHRLAQQQHEYRQHARYHRTHPQRPMQQQQHHTTSPWQEHQRQPRRPTYVSLHHRCCCCCCCCWCGW